MQALFLVAALLGQEMNHPMMGHLVIAGGGPTDPEIIAKALALAGGKKAHVLIVPQASYRADAGARSEAAWRAAGAENIHVLDPRNHDAALAAIRQADLIWMPGGSQGHLMEVLRAQGLVDAIRQRFHQGATIGGTSAGAAVMSLTMLTGECLMDRVTDGGTKVAEGLGLWPDVIVDQHYLRRNRWSRLLSAVLDHPDAVGVGIDECTAVVVTGRTFEVIGKSNVIVLDARKTVRMESKGGEPEAAANLAMHVLRAGMRFDLDHGLLPDWNGKVTASTSPVTKKMGFSAR